MVRKSHLLLVFLLMASLLTGCNQSMEQNPNANKKEVLKTTSTDKKPETDRDVMIITGKIEAVQSANLVSKVAGKVDAIHVDIGSAVRAGQVLVSLSAEDKAADIEEAETQVETAQVEYDLAQKAYQRGKELIEAQAIAQADFDNLYEGPFKKAEVKLKAAQASVKKKQIAYQDMFIAAPFTGVITAKNVNPGEMAGTQTALVTLVNLNQVVVKGIVNENQINKLKKGQQVQVLVKAAAEKPFTGKIANIALAADAQSKGFPIKVQVDNPEYLLKPGMFAEVTIK